ncbi:terminase small subunit [Peptoniphilus duerdenii]|nr:terminase small subunit [Peptoniphilus duerdenii]
MALTIKQKQVADDYIITGNKTESYLKFYKNVKNRETARANSCRLFATQDMKDYIEERMKELDEELIADQREVLRYLTSVVRGQETQQTLIGVGKCAQKITNIELNASDKIKAAELIGKRFGMWTDKVELESNDKVVIIDDTD